MNWNGRRVLLTGHTGFKGSWLALWLQGLGAELCGLALKPPTAVNLFEDARVGQGMRSVIGDIRDADSARQSFSSITRRWSSTWLRSRWFGLLIRIHWELTPPT